MSCRVPPCRLTSLSVAALAIFGAAGCSRAGGREAPGSPAPAASAASAATLGPAGDAATIRDIQNNPTLSESTKRMYIDAVRKSGQGSETAGAPAP